ncbi:MAG: ribonuclease HI [Planctomycetales bacterium]
MSDASQDGENALPFVRLFTDGGCSGNPGPGGWGFVLKHPASGKSLEGSGAESETTNNRMELIAVIQGLESLKAPSRVELVSDSKYVGNGLRDWMPKWKANDWKRRQGSRWAAVKNDDLWKQLDALLAPHQFEYTWVAGHSGHPENERCDELAVAAYQRYLR